MRRLNGDEYLVVMQAAEFVGQSLQDRRVISDLVEEEGADHGGTRRRGRGDAARTVSAGIEQRGQGERAADARAQPHTATEKSSATIPAWQRRGKHVAVRLSAVC